MKMKYLSGIMLLFAVLSSGCGSSDDNDNTGGTPGGDLVLTVDRNVLLNDGEEAAVFKVMDGTKEVTYACMITETTVGAGVVKGTFSSVKNGEYVFVAKWGSKVSNEVKITVSGEVAFLKNMLMIESTSVHCVFCPGMTSLIRNQVLPKYPGRVQVVSFHSTLMGKDVMAVKEYDEPWRAHFYISSLPTVVIDYHQLWTLTSPMSVVDNIMKEPTTVGVGITTALSGQELTIDLKVRATETPEYPCKLVVMLTEDGILADQASNGEGGGMIEHEWVLRKFLTNIFGDGLADNAVRKDNEYTKKLTFTVPAEWNVQKMHAIVCILDGKTGKMMNCQGVKLGESIDYQYKN